MNLCYPFPDQQPFQGPLVPHILVIDDDRFFRQLIESVAEELPLTVTTVDPCKNFDALPMSDDYDVALIDYRLGHYNGLQVARLYPDIPVLIISSRSEPDDAYWTWPVQNFVSKGLGPLHLLNLARQLAQFE